jgi:hypothetical protein
MIRAFLNWLADTGVLPDSPADGLVLAVDPAGDRVREIVVPDFRFRSCWPVVYGTRRID